MLRMYFTKLVPLTAVVLVMLFTSFSPTVAAEQAQSRPNIIVFYTDDMRDDELVFMPETCKLLRSKGVSYDRFYSNNPLCCPMRATLVTGQYSHNNGVYSNERSTHGGIYWLNKKNTIPRYLQKSGYLTGYIGKYLNGYRMPINGTPKDYDEWFVPYRGIYSYNNTTINDNGTSKVTKKYITDVYANETNRTIRRFSKDAQNRPFVLYVSHLAPHSTETSSEPIPADRHKGTVKVKDLPRRTLEADVTDKPSWIQKLPAVNASAEARISKHEVKRAESLKAVDEAVASMVKTLKDTGELDNTIIMFTSDNGYMLGEHRIPHGKIVPYEPSARVPLLVRGPGFPAGTVREDVVGAVDLGQTILDITGASVPYPVDGQSLLQRSSSRKMLLESGPSLFTNPKPLTTTNGELRFYTAVVTKKWKLIRYYDGQVELYSMKGGRSENVNLAHDKRYKSQVESLSKTLRELRNCSGVACVIN